MKTPTPYLEVELSAVQEYFEKCLIAQKQRNNFGVEWPVIPKNLDKKTTIVLKAYLNMARVWSNAGGLVPNPKDIVELLYTMGNNGIAFRSTKAKSRFSFKHLT